jgi:predicted permease
MHHEVTAMLRNVTLASRMLRKTPIVTSIAVLSLALGIGANAAIFSLFEEILWRKLPVTAPERLANFKNPGPIPGSNSCNQAGGCDEVFSYAMFRDLEKAPAGFSGIAAHRTTTVSFSVRNEPSTGEAVMVSGGYFNVLGIRAASGRLFTPDDDKVVGANFVVVLSHAFWKNAFGGDPAAVGQSIVVNGKSYAILGVAPEGFEGTTTGSRPMVYVPISMQPVIEGFKRWENRRSYWMYVFGRLKPDATLASAASSINAIYSPIINDVEAPLQQGLSEPTMASFRKKRVELTPGARGQSSVHREARTPIMLLFSVTLVVLLIACANIANLLLARGARRATEMGVRLALGATRRHLVAQLLTESVLLAVAGGIASLFVAKWTLNVVMAILPPEAASTMTFGISRGVITFSALLSVGTGFFFGLFPALHSTRGDLISSIRAGAGQIAGGRAATRFRTALVTAQIALSMGLLIMSALFLKSLVNVSRVDLGVKVSDVAGFLIEPQQVGYDSVRSAVLFTRVEQELAAIPGVTGVTSGLVPLLRGDNWGNDAHVQGYPCGPDVDCGSRFNEIGSDYFKTFGVQLKAGREFTLADQLGAQRVAIVNQAFAKKFKLGNDAVGKFMGTETDDTLNVQIIGLVPDVKYSSVKDSVPPVYYVPWRQDAGAGALFFYVKTSLPPERILTALRATIKRIDPSLPVEELKTMPQQVRENIFMERMISILSSGFALLATLLAGVGLYGVLSFSVQQRTRELGVRMALGADGDNIRSLVLKQVGVMMLIGGTIGVAAALGLGRVARSQLYQLEGHDPVALLSAVLLLTIVAFAAALVPAQRAARVDPMLALRYD